MQLALERGDVATPKAPLPPLLERRKDALPRELVDRVRTEIQETRNLLAVEKNVVFFVHPVCPSSVRRLRLANTIS
jgi:hypothetical protein